MDQEVIPNSLVDFMDRFESLAGEAAQYGLRAVYGVIEHDPLSQSSSHGLGWNASPYEVIGIASVMVDTAKKDLEKGE